MKWTPFVKVGRVLRPTQSELEAQAKALNVPLCAVVSANERICKEDTMYQNNIYNVMVNTSSADVSPDWPEMIHLSIRRVDRARVGKERYRDFMRIRDELVGDQHEAVELYPARVREIDTVNQYHLWVMKDRRNSFPFGWWAGRLCTSGSVGGAVQSPIKPEHDWDSTQTQLSFPFDALS